MAKSVKRRAKKPALRKTVKKKAKKASRAKGKSTAVSALAVNRKAHWDAYKELQKKVDKAWDKLRSDVAKKAKPQVLVQDKNELLLLLGECNYMARECMRLSKKSGNK